MRRILRALRDRRGAVAMLAGLSALPLLLMAGAAIDLTRLYLLHSRLVTATDAAALAGARAINDADRDTQIQRWFWANFTRERPGLSTGFLGAEVTSFNIGVEEGNRVVRVRVQASLPTTVLRLFGREVLSATADNAARRQDRGMELALVLDVTGSMAGSAMTALRDSATDLINIIYGPNETVPNLWVSVVPYTATVNIGRSRSNWLVAGSLIPTDYGSTVWRGCVQARHQNREDETDTPPTIVPYRPFLWRSTVGRYSPNLGDNEWTNTTITEPNPENPPSDSAQNSLGNNARGPNLGCGRAILPLTQARGTILNEISNLRATHRGGTMANLGLQMGWANLSPRWRGLWGSATLPLDYGTPYMDKVLVLMTDGNNEWHDWAEGAPGACRTSGSSPPCRSGYVNDGDADVTAYGRLRENRLGLANPTNANARAEIDARMSRLCASIKQAGIIVYTVTFNVSASSTQTLYRNCASRPEYYFNSPDAAALRSAFREIAGQLANLRLIQ
ncbi:Flp pilus assembly protein TadG [Roseomonas sp. PWR1]|uniref:Flp pilus assembly protein TadG n=1 Tax=Roseomonas nitratireducens TaxID=2820810 RepID=A0ABS4APC7_9PROT|nr:pilus assembly protein TadG-related protein [Neoroseomonas nitratireducens]MBP0463209.1 Flp pilus assembly protein TadG [Neoroseomonas nitratireducens]